MVPPCLTVLYTLRQGKPPQRNPHDSRKCRAPWTRLKLDSAAHASHTERRHVLHGHREAVMKSLNRFLKKAVIVGIGLCFVLPAVPQSDHTPNTQEIQALVQRAKQGEENAQLELGLSYYNGSGVPQNFVKAAEWFDRAASQGDAAAKNNLGLMYLDGQGVTADPKKAIRCFREAADMNDTKAQFNLALSYETGRGVEQNYLTAANWYERAADNGQPTAQNNLGIMYFFGQGVEQDLVTAHMWLNLAAAQGHAGARRARDLVAESMTMDEIEQAQRLAVEREVKHQ